MLFDAIISWAAVFNFRAQLNFFIYIHVHGASGSSN